MSLLITMRVVLRIMGPFGLQIILQHSLFLGKKIDPEAVQSELGAGIVGLPNVGKSTLFNALCDTGEVLKGSLGIRASSLEFMEITV